jgi:hypothetical protein
MVFYISIFSHIVSYFRFLLILEANINARSNSKQYTSEIDVVKIYWLIYPYKLQGTPKTTKACFACSGEGNYHLNRSKPPR